VSEQHHEVGVGVPAVSRREALKRGALAGGVLVWTVPVVQAVSLTAAHAESPSAPPVGGGVGGGGGVGKPGAPGAPGAPNTPSGPNAPGGPSAPGGSIGQAAPIKPAAPAEHRGPLPFTGTSVPVLEAAVVGAGLVATGVTATVVAGKVKAASAVDSPPPASPVEE
jgi:hypothetical protein